MPDPITREKVCKIRGCPWPNSDDWHTPICGHATKAGHHHHITKRSQGGTTGPQVFICVVCHDKIDNGPWGNAAYKDERTGHLHFRVWKLNNETVYDVDIDEWWPPKRRVLGGEGGRRASGDRNAARSTRDQQPHSPAPASGYPGNILVPDNEWIEQQALKAQERPQNAYPGLSVATPDATPDVSYEATGLVLREALSWERWVEIGGTLQQMERSIQWWLGDWLRYGEANYGERYTQAVEATGLKVQALMNYVWVASKVEPSTRVETLSWSHHREVAALPEPEQVALLERAESEGLTTRELHLAIAPKAGCFHVFELVTIRRCKGCGKEV